MLKNNDHYRLYLRGVFRLEEATGTRVRVTSRRSKALIAMLATARNGERTRSWLQAQLWGSRAEAQAKASLRRELSNLRPILNTQDPPLLLADHDRVILDLNRIELDIHDRASTQHNEDLLEGFEIPGEEGFEDWLRELRARDGFATENPRNASGRPRTVRANPPQASFPSITVLTVGDQPNDTHAAIHEGIGHALIDRISRLRWMTVVMGPRAPLTDADPEQIEMMASRLQVEYLLLVEMATQDRLALTLCKAGTGQILWSDHSYFPESLTQDTLETVLARVVAVLSSKIESDQKMDAMRHSFGPVSTNQLLWKARWHMRRYKREDAQIAEALFEEALAEGGDEHEILVEKLYLHALAAWNRRADPGHIEELRKEAIRRKDFAPYDCRAHFLCGVFDMWLCKHGQAAANLEQAIELNPSMSNAYGQLGSCHNLDDRPAIAVPILETALRLNPLDTENFHQHGELAFAHLALSEFEEALASADRALALKSGYAYAQVLKIAALIQIGETTTIREAYATLTRSKHFANPSFLNWIPYADRSWPNRLKAAVEEAAKI